ncbi:MerR family transcriptional regulator [Pedococcus sp. 5OH_020]|uniref:MerR family transcriptional regulator n=1 Tax=Pedococcus sp. 5OH_020 TaxID=2989814 RepID=UPI0022E9F880|nr:MerR family transcriptional regulator [Pedococcus sp. 5OH_020]
MLTIGQLASYAGVTIRAVRHYHAKGLLPEPGRDSSGYRSYDAGAVVRLIRIRTLAEAGVPLARVQALLDADPETFAAALQEIDRRLRSEIRELQDHRRRIAQLGGGDTLAVPKEVTDYLELVRRIGAPDQLVEAERDAWILIAARYPEQIPYFMADKRAQLEDPRTVRFYRLIGGLLSSRAEDHEPLLREMADLLVELFEEADQNGQLDRQDEHMDDPAFVQLLDSMAGNHPVVPRLRELLAERGWAGWTRVERA